MTSQREQRRAIARYTDVFTAELNRPAYYRWQLLNYIRNRGFDVSEIRHKTTLDISFDRRVLSFNDLKACLRSLMRHANSSIILSKVDGGRWLARRSGNRPLRFVRF
jgi:hypothetical protein